MIAVFADPHAHAQALDAVIAAADAAGAEALWSLGDMVGGVDDGLEGLGVRVRVAEDGYKAYCGCGTIRM